MQLLLKKRIEQISSLQNKPKSEINKPPFGVGLFLESFIGYFQINGSNL